MQSAPTAPDADDRIVDDPAVDLSDDPTVHPTGDPTGHPTSDLLADELVIEEISIDGMCGVY